MLLSYAFFGGDDLAKYRQHMPCGRLLIDSGAFTAASVGKRIDLTEYAEFLGTWRGVYDHAVTLDVIGDPVATRKNTQRLHGMGHRVMPVFTRGGSTKEFDAMVRDSGYVCVGGGVGMPRDLVVRRLSALQRRAEELGGGIHALGVGNLEGLRRIRPYSADASNVSSSFRFGTLVCYTGQRLVMVSVTDTARIRQHLHHFKAQGLRMAQVAKTRRQPNGTERGVLMQGLSMAVVCADEDTARFQVPVPHGVKDTSGTHMYSAVTGSHLAPAVAHLDTLLHDDQWSVPIWERYRTQHATQCRARTREGALA